MPESTADPRAFGRALAKSRLARGYTQQQVAERIPTYYSDGGAYGRIERSERTPERDTIIAILTRGLLILNVDEINPILQLANYEGLAAEDMERFGISPKPGDQPPHEGDQGSDGAWDWHLAGVLGGSLATSCLVALFIQQHTLFVLLTSFLYAALYAVSLYLESAFEPRASQTRKAAVWTFGFVAVSSTLALAADSILIDSGNPYALLFSLFIFLGSAIAQFFIARPALSEAAIVPAAFQTRTAQSAHLKNTGYFLLIVVVFWLPPFNCIATFARQMRVGQADWVRELIVQELMAGRGVIALSAAWLLGLLLVLFLISLYMGYYLLDKLQPNPQLNSFTLLFYLRAFLYFVLCLICIGWYAFSLGELG